MRKSVLVSCNIFGYDSEDIRVQLGARLPSAFAQI